MLRICREDGAILFALLSFGAWDFQYKFFGDSRSTVGRLTVDVKTTTWDFRAIDCESVREESEHARGEETAQLQQHIKPTDQRGMGVLVWLFGGGARIIVLPY